MERVGRAALERQVGAADAGNERQRLRLRTLAFGHQAEHAARSQVDANGQLPVLAGRLQKQAAFAVGQGDAFGRGRSARCGTAGAHDDAGIAGARTGR